MSELITDLANDILSCPDWDPEKVHIPHKQHIQEPELQLEETHYGQAFAADVDIPPIPNGIVKSYIDDLIPVILYQNNNTS